MHPSPHSGCPPQDEKERIEALGGFVSHMDCWRVNGTLAVSRAIGKGVGDEGLLPEAHGLTQLLGTATSYADIAPVVCGAVESD